MNKLKIGIDAMYIREKEASGVKKYAEEVLKGFEENCDKYEFVLFVDSDLKEFYSDMFKNFKIVSLKIPFKNVKYIRGIFNRTITKSLKKRVLKKEKCDIIFHPFVDDITPILYKKNEILTIHDLIPIDSIEDKESKLYKTRKKALKRIIDKGNNIVTISQYSKDRMIELSDNDGKNITVIPNAVKKPTITKEQAEEKYILSINAFNIYKNQMTLVKAFNIIRDKIEDKLVLVGRPELDGKTSSYNDIVDFIDENDLKDRVQILSYISDEERDKLLCRTDLFVSTSTIEGFGRTPVEAAMCEVPVITTKETALPETTMNLLYYYDNPYDENELATEMLKILNNKPSDAKLKEISL